MKKLKLKKAALVAFIISIFTLIAACDSGEGSGLRDGQDRQVKEETAWDRIQKEGKIKVATSGTLYPTSYHDAESDELTGFEVEIVKELARRLNLEVEFVEMAFDGMLTSINSGQVDIAANDISITEERKEKFAFSDPYKFSFATMIVRKDDLSGIKTIEDIKGKKAAGEATTVYMDIARMYGAEEVIYDNATNELYLRDVATGRTDLIINDYYLQKLALEAFPDLNITIHPDIKFKIPNEGTGIIMKKGETELQENINKVIREMLEDGTISELSKRFFGGDDVTVMPELEY